MMELNLGLRPRQSDNTLKCRRVVKLIRQVEHLSAGRRDHRPESHAYGGAGWNQDPATKAEDRIEHGPHRAGQRSAIRNALRRTNLVSPAEKTRPVGFILDGVDAFTLNDGKVCRPDFRFAG